MFTLVLVNLPFLSLSRWNVEIYMNSGNMYYRTPWQNCLFLFSSCIHTSGTLYGFHILVVICQDWGVGATNFVCQFTWCHKAAFSFFSALLSSAPQLCSTTPWGETYRGIVLIGLHWPKFVAFYLGKLIFCSHFQYSVVAIWQAQPPRPLKDWKSEGVLKILFHFQTVH